MPGMENNKFRLARTSKVIAVDGAQDSLGSRKESFTLENDRRFLEDVPSLEREQALMLFEEAQKLLRKGQIFEYHEDAILKQAAVVNRLFGKEVVAVVRSLDERNRQGFKLKFDFDAMKKTYQVILDAEGNLLPSRKKAA